VPTVPNKHKLSETEIIGDKIVNNRDKIGVHNDFLITRILFVLRVLLCIPHIPYIGFLCEDLSCMRPNQGSPRDTPSYRNRTCNDRTHISSLVLNPPILL
jgi:hypothetical protein